MKTGMGWVFTDDVRAYRTDEPCAKVSVSAPTETEARRLLPSRLPFGDADNFTLVEVRNHDAERTASHGLLHPSMGA